MRVQLLQPPPMRIDLHQLLALCALWIPFTMSSAADYHLQSYGAIGSDIAANTATLQSAIDACAAAGGGRVIVPTGAPIVIGSIQLRSHVELYLERGAMLQGSPKCADFTHHAPPPVWFDSTPVVNPGVIVYAEHADDIAISGPGRIDGNQLAYVSETGPEIFKCPNERPFTVVFKECRGITIRDVALTNGAFWTLRLFGCDDALVDGVRITGDLRMPNNDGIDIDWSSNVRIQGCHIVTGDDCISLKTSPLNLGITRACENVVITNCTLRSRSTGIVIGCDVSGPIRDVVVSNCVIKDSHRGVAVRLSLGGSIERVLFSNLMIETRIFDDRWWGRGEPIQVLALPWTEKSELGHIRDIRFSNLICRAENGAIVYAAEPGHISGITFDRVSIHLDKTSEFPGGRQDLRPSPGNALPEIPTSGFLLRHAEGVTFRDSQITWGEHRPSYYRHALDAKDSPGLDASGLTGEAAQAGLAARDIR